MLDVSNLVVRRRTAESDGVVSLELQAPDGGELPGWEPGAHVDLLLADGIVRQYSLCGDPLDTATWRIAVLREPDGRGGSTHIHDHLHEGADIAVRGPRNHFALDDSPRYVFVAGGIGITPIMAMAHRAEQNGTEWQMYYLGRSQASMPFTHDLTATYPERVTVWADEQRGTTIDLGTLLDEPDDQTLIYCCGPGGLIDAVERRTTHWPDGALHIERFAAKDQPDDVASEALDTFQVECRRSGITVDVGAEQPILEALEDADIPIMSSCLEGMCGTCQTGVLEGTPDHRDSLLSDADRDAGHTILPCVSRSRTPMLVLDL
ncbi:PDR/VanB family oxidoreductase [Gordonia sinesedis]